MSKKNEKRSKGFKVLSLVLAFVLVIGASVAGTLAWLTAKTDTVKNTFASAELFDSNGYIDLWENKAEDVDGDGQYTLNNSVRVKTNTYDILPGVDIPKNPYVDVVKLKEHAYLYIKVTGLPMGDGLTAVVDTTNWTELLGYDGLYVYSGTEAENNIIKATDDDPITFTATILADNEIRVADSYEGTSDDITLSFDAYMVQATGNGVSAAAAWANTYGAPQNP